MFSRLLASLRGQRLSFVLAAELDAEDALQFAENLLVGNCFAGLVLVDNLRLLADFGRQVLVRGVKREISFNNWLH